MTEGFSSLRRVGWIFIRRFLKCLLGGFLEGVRVVVVGWDFISF